MQKHSVVAIVQALNEREVRYLIAGGLAVVAHGFVRFTADVDLVFDLENQNLDRALAALATLGYRPRAPVDLFDFADAALRAAWVQQKGLTVFSLYSRQHPATEIDVFVEPPFDFVEAYSRAARHEVDAGVIAPFVGLTDLIAMKRRAGRPQDLLDIDSLATLRKPAEDDEGR